MAFFAEIKRRRVGKVAIAYGTIAWLVTEASSVVLPALHLPDWTVTFVVVFLLVGFPVAMILAWIFDVGPQVRRASSAPNRWPASPSRPTCGSGSPIRRSCCC
jgi:hypothetical protein